MSKRAATDFDNSHARISNIDDGDKGSGPVSGPSLSEPTNATSAISSMTVAALKAQLMELAGPHVHVRLNRPQPLRDVR